MLVFPQEKPGLRGFGALEVSGSHSNRINIFILNAFFLFCGLAVFFKKYLGASVL